MRAVLVYRFVSISFKIKTHHWFKLRTMESFLCIDFVCISCVLNELRMVLIRLANNGEWRHLSLCSILFPLIIFLLVKKNNWGLPLFDSLLMNKSSFVLYWHDCRFIATKHESWVKKNISPLKIHQKFINLFVSQSKQIIISIIRFIGPCLKV